MQRSKARDMFKQNDAITQQREYIWIVSDLKTSKNAQ